MSKKFLLALPDSEHQSLKVAAAQIGVSMHTFIRDAIKEKILREQTANTLYARDAGANDAAALAKVNTEKLA